MGVAEKLRILITVLLVERASKQKVRDVFRRGVAVGAVGGRAGSCGKVSSGGAVATSGAWRAVPGLIIGRGGVKGRVKAVAVPCGVAAATEQNGVGVGTGVDVAVGARLIVEALLFSSAAVAGGVSGKPVGAAAETRNGAAVCVRDGVVRKVRLRGE